LASPCEEESRPPASVSCRKRFSGYEARRPWMQERARGDPSWPTAPQYGHAREFPKNTGVVRWPGQWPHSRVWSRASTEKMNRTAARRSWTIEPRSVLAVASTADQDPIANHLGSGGEHHPAAAGRSRPTSNLPGTIVRKVDISGWRLSSRTQRLVPSAA